MRRFQGALLCAMTAAALCVAGCGDDDPDKAEATTQATKVAKVAYLDSSSNTFVAAEHEGFNEVIKAQGGSVKQYNSNFDPQKQFTQCQDAIATGRYNVIVLSIFDPPTGVPCVKAAKAANIPVISAGTPAGTDADDLKPQVDGVLGGVYITPATNARNGVELTTLACEGLDPCKVVVEVITPTDPVTNLVADQIKAKVPNVEIVQKIVTGFDPAQIAKQMPDILSATPDLDVFVAGADTQALAALPALKDAGMDGKVKVLGSGGSREGVAAIKDGSLFGSHGSWPVQMGKLVAEMVIKGLNGQKIDPIGVDALLMDEPRILTKETVDQFSPEWGN